MNIEIKFESFPTKIEATKISKDGIKLEISSKGTNLEVEMDIEVAEELMEQLSKQINGYYVSDKVTELQGDIDELTQQARDMEENKINVKWEDVA